MATWPRKLPLCAALVRDLLVKANNPHLWVTRGWVGLTRICWVGRLGFAGEGRLGFVELLRSHQLPPLPPQDHTSLLVVHRGTQSLPFLLLSSSISPVAPSSTWAGRSQWWEGRCWPRRLWRVRSGNWIQQSSLRAGRPSCSTLLIVICTDGHRRWRDGPARPNHHIGWGWVAQQGILIPSYIRKSATPALRSSWCNVVERRVLPKKGDGAQCAEGKIRVIGGLFSAHQGR